MTQLSVATPRVCCTMQFHHARTAAELVEQLVALWSGPHPDPFAFDLAVVPGTGFQRWLSQQLAIADDPAGVCAGIEFATLEALEWRLDGRDDPWRPERLVWLVQQVTTTSRGKPCRPLGNLPVPKGSVSSSTCSCGMSRYYPR